MFSIATEFYTQAQPFVVRAARFMEKHSLGDRAGIDHICYKCHPGGAYEFHRSILEGSEVSVWAEQEWISGRRVSYFRLKFPLRFDHWTISFVELQDSKPGSDDQPGFHHAEIYPWEGAMDYSELREVLAQGGEDLIFKDRPHHSTHDIQLLDPLFIIRVTENVLVKKIAKKMWGGL